MNISNTYDDLDLSFIDTEMVMKEANNTGGSISNSTDTVVKVLINSNDNVSYNCKICHNLYIGNPVSDNHMSNNHCEGSNICETCHNVFLVKSLTDNHMLNNHGGNVNSCIMCCDLLFSPTFNGVHQVSSIHKKYSCEMFLAGESGFVLPTPVELPTIKKSQKNHKNKKHIKNIKILNPNKKAVRCKKK